MVTVQPVRLADADKTAPPGPKPQDPKTGEAGTGDPGAEFQAGLRALQENRGEDDRLVDLLAFALAAAAGQRVTHDNMAALRQQAQTELGTHAMRYLHNRVEEIRLEAVQERLGGLRRPPGLLKLVVANLLALGVAAAAIWWLAGQPDILARFTGAIRASLGGTPHDVIAGLAGLIAG